MAADYRHRPVALRLVNGLGQRLKLARTLTLEPDSLLDAAVRAAGSDDFGPNSWRDGFVRLCTALEDEARLNLVGRISARRHLLQLLCNRLEVEAARRADAGIAAQRIESPIFITGLPRTGSTLLHGLIGADPRLRVPWTWEIMLPGPLPPGADDDADSRRVRRTEAMLRWVHRFAPRFRAIHPIGARLPQECIAITAHDFASVEFHTTFDVPGYQRWLDSDDASGYASAMRYHRRIAQHLQRHTGKRRWVFKAPAHLPALDAVIGAYPDAQFVFTTRDPQQVVASIASHGAVLRSAFSDTVDVAQVAHNWMHWWAEGWQRALAFRRRHPQRFVDLGYTTTVADPLAAVERLYQRLGLGFDTTTAAAMQQFLRQNSQHKHGRHRYTLEQFGLDAHRVQQLFPDHRDDAIPEVSVEPR